jgi:mRNA interferase HigB
MKVVGRNVLDAFCRRHVDARQWVEHWLSEVEEASWGSPQQVRDRYVSATFAPRNRVLFGVMGNDYRLEVTVAYKTGTVVVQWAGLTPSV